MDCSRGAARAAASRGRGGRAGDDAQGYFVRFLPPRPTMLGWALAFALRRAGTVAVALRAAGGCSRIAASSEPEASTVGALPCRAAAARATPTSGAEAPRSGERLPNRELGGLTRGHFANGTRQRGPDQRPMHGAFGLVHRIGLRLRSRGYGRRPMRLRPGARVRPTVRNRMSPVCAASRREPPGRARRVRPSSFAVAAPWPACIRVRCHKSCSGSASRPVRPSRQWRDW